MSLCKYKNIFGEPGTGAHSYRIPILDIAAMDFILTIIAALIITQILVYIYKCDFEKIFVNISIILFLSGIIMHRIFCVKTTVDKALFDDKS